MHGELRPYDALKEAIPFNYSGYELDGAQLTGAALDQYLSEWRLAGVGIGNETGGTGGATLQIADLDLSRTA